MFSHLSSHHVVFTIDRGSSLSRVRESPLLQPETIEVVEGPTQRTLPMFRFEHPIQAALIDGPHAYPFPDLEYFFIYPLLDEGALLIIDDIDIPSIARMVRILKDEMFRLIQVVGRTAFFERTAAPLFDPYGDGWGKQGYNAAHKRLKSRIAGFQARYPRVYSVLRRLLRDLRRWF